MTRLPLYIIPSWSPECSGVDPDFDVIEADELKGPSFACYGIDYYALTDHRRRPGPQHNRKPRWHKPSIVPDDPPASPYPMNPVLYRRAMEHFIELCERGA